MKRIKNLGLAVFTALALTAVLGVAGASASEFTSESYPSTLTSSPSTHTLKFNIGNMECEAPSLEGSLAAQSTTISPTAKDNTCTFFGAQPLKMNGCKFFYRPAAEKSAGVFEGKIDIGPSNCGPIQIGTTKSLCLVSISPKSSFNATYENTGAGKTRAVKVTTQMEGLKYTQANGSCENGTFENGSWSGSWTIKGSNGLWLEKGATNEQTQSGINVGGSPPKFISASYPRTIVGQKIKGASQKLGFPYGSLECTTMKFNSSISGATAQLEVAPEYSGCTWVGIVASVNMNGCSYSFNLEAVGPPYAGNLGIACPAGKTIEIVANPSGTVKCTATIGAQTTNAGGLAFTNEPESAVKLTLGVSGIKYHQQEGAGSGHCTGTGDFTNGTYTGSSLLTGV